MSYEIKTREIFEALKSIRSLSFKRISFGAPIDIKVNKTAYVSFAPDGFVDTMNPHYLNVRVYIAVCISDKIEAYERDNEALEVGTEIVNVLMQNDAVSIEDFSAQALNDSKQNYSFFNISGLFLIDVAH